METQPAFSLETEDVLRDYRLALKSRETSLVGRREVLSGKAKFGIFGDGKEVTQLALARAFQPGDWRSGYYRDQTLMMALDLLSVQEFFAQLFAHANHQADPSSAGRQMNAHFATHYLDEKGDWLNQTDRVNVSADLSPTGSQMPRLVGLGYASRLYRELEELQHLTQFSQQGNEVAFGTIGNASCAEGMFWESVNAIGVLHAPVVITIYDDEYGISVPNKYQITRANLSEVLSGFQREDGSSDGYDLYTVRGWDYPAQVETFQQAAETARREHVPAIVHVIEMTQPQGHSTSGSHERYKSSERLTWEEEHDCIRQMRRWLLDQGLTTEAELESMEAEAKSHVEAARTQAWESFTGETEAERDQAFQLIDALAEESGSEQVLRAGKELKMLRQPLRKDIMAAARQALFSTRGQESAARHSLIAWSGDYWQANEDRYSSHLHSEDADSALNVPEVAATYAPDAVEIPGFQILNANFEALMARYPRLIAFGEDVGHLGGVNQGFAGLQAKYGELRVSDTGIRETTIIGQAIGMAMRGLRPIAEIQYLDYLLYALQILSDDLATLRWRSVGRQKAPVIIRTRGHRLEGVWHSGSLLGGAINLLRGIHVLVPRNMTQAAGFYNTLLQAEEPGLIVEVLNGYRLREKLPANLGEFTLPLGIPETLREGQHITLATYGAMVRVALEAAERLSAETGIELEVIDVRSLLPFDLNGQIAASIRKTNRVIFADEDVPGGTSAYMMQQVLERDAAYWHLDSQPRCISAQAHRPPYGSDGNYFAKPSVEDLVEAAYDLMNEFNPAQYPGL